MQPPLDYPIDRDPTPSDALGEITYAALLDRHASEQPITREMIDRACRRMDTAQQFPFAVSDDSADSGLGRLLRVFR